MKWYWVSLPYATGGVGVEFGRVEEAPPIFKWMVGKSQLAVWAWLARKNAEVEQLPDG